VELLLVRLLWICICVRLSNFSLVRGVSIVVVFIFLGFGEGRGGWGGVRGLWGGGVSGGVCGSGVFRDGVVGGEWWVFFCGVGVGLCVLELGGGCEVVVGVGGGRVFWVWGVGFVGGEGRGFRLAP